jgi:DNA end-binding protein Ku
LGRNDGKQAEIGGKLKMSEEGKIRSRKGSVWSGTITIGLVNVPVKLHIMIFDKSVTFKFLHKTDGSPLKYQKVCIKEDKVIPWEDIVKGYEIRKNEFVVFTNEDLKAARPESDQRMRIDKFIDYFSIDPVYFDRSYILAPDKNSDAYSLLLTALEKMGKAGVGRITLRTKEYPILVHPYNGALVLTTLRYAYEVADPRKLEEIKELKEPKKEELDLAKKIITDLSGEFDITEYKDTFRQKVEELVQKKTKGEKIIVEKPVKEEARELMVALQETLKQLKKK